MVKIITLGCGGGRHQTIDQTFKTGGFRIHDEKFKLHVDPGPGALLLTNKFGLEPKNLDAVFVSHAHPDHYTDAEILMGAMSDRQNDDDGRILASKTVIEGKDDIGPVISSFYKNKVSEAVSLGPNESYELNEQDIRTTPTKHTDPTCVGFKIETEAGKIGYTADTEMIDGLAEIFGDVRVLLGNVTRPANRRIDDHLCSEDFADILKIANPDLGIILHMGMLFMKNSPDGEASKIEDISGVRTIPGFSGTEIDFSDSVNIKSLSEQRDYQKFY